MVRQKSRNKTIEDLYSSQEKYSSNQYPGFPGKLPVVPAGKPRNIDKDVFAPLSHRRKSRKPVEKKDEKTMINEEKLIGDGCEVGVKKETSLKNGKSTKEDKNFSGLQSNYTPMFDNKNLVSFMEHQKSDQEKDEDTEEFFELIRETVETAVGKAISGLLSQSFRDINLKVANITEQLTATNDMITKLQAEVNNKVVHYGEENSRHFRYLCMKSEYDKMFYQHQNMMTNVPAEARPNLMQPFPATVADKVQVGCNTCRANSEQFSSPEQKPKSCDDRSVSTRSSDMGMKEVLEQIQKFCVQLQQNEKAALNTIKRHKIPRLPIRGHGLRCSAVDEEDIGDDDIDDDDDDLNMSSDEMSLMSEEGKRKNEDCEECSGRQGKM